MNNSTIRIALSSVLIYLSIKKLYGILMILLMWVNVKLRIENEAILISLNIAIGILSVLTLIVLVKKILSKTKIENPVIYLLVGLVTFLTISMGVLNKYYGEYLATIELDDFKMTNLFQHSWSIALEATIPILGLLYYLWKMKNNMPNNT